MYINTNSKDSMEIDICKYLNISIGELYKFFLKIAIRQKDKLSFNRENDFNNITNEFIKSHSPKNVIDEILIFHLSRRLKTTENINYTNNLFELLSTKNAFSEFFKKHDVTFSYDSKCLNLFYKGNLKSLDIEFNQKANYLKSRLCHNPNRKDVCFNGFAFKDLLYNNRYTWALYEAPEFITGLSDFLNNKDIESDYFSNSTFYCFEYLVPIEKVIFTSSEDISNDNKHIYLINNILYRLYNYYCCNKDYNYDEDNPILRLSDSDTMLEEYFINKEEIILDSKTNTFIFK